MANKNFRVKHGLEVAGSATVENDLTVTGNLTVNGTTTTLNTATLAVEDNIVVLNSNVTGTPGTNAGIEVERGDSTNSALTWNESDDKWYQDRAGVSTVIPVSTAELTESGNLYYTDGRARAAVSGGTGVTYSSSTGVIAIGQSVATTADVTFNTVNANITDDNYVLGQLIATRNTAYVPPASPLTTLAGQNGIVVVSGNGGLGYAPNITIRQHVGDTTAGTAVAGGISMSSASGTNTAPTGTSINSVIGTFNYDGYTAGTSNNYANTIATTNQGGGTTSISPLQAQAYARQAFTNSTTVTTAVTGASGTGTTATLTFTTQNTAPYAVGQTVTVAGMTPSGYNGTYVITAATTSSISYANATTGFTTGGTIGAANTVTAAGMGFRIRGYANSTPLTVANRFNFMDLTASAAAFKSNTYTFANEVITGSTLTATNYMTLGPTGISMGNVDGISNFIRASGTTVGTRPALSVRNTQTVTATPSTGDGATFRLATAGSNANIYNLAEIGSSYSSTGDTSISFNIANGDQNGATMSIVQPLLAKLSGTIIAATATPTATAGGNTLTAVAIFTPTNTTIKSNAVTLQTNAGVALVGSAVSYNRVYGQWQYDATVTAAAANTAYAYPIAGPSGVTDLANIATVGSTSRIIPGAAGTYKLQFSVQVDNADNGADHTAFFWWRKNGVDVPASMGRVHIAKSADTIGGWDNMIQSANTTDYWELMYAVDDTNVTLPYYAATAFGPSTASMFITLVPVGA